MDKFFKTSEPQFVVETPIHEKTIPETTESVESDNADENYSHFSPSRPVEPT